MYARRRERHLKELWARLVRPERRHGWVCPRRVSTHAGDEEARGSEGGGVSVVPHCATYAYIYRAGSANAHPTPLSLFDYIWPGGASNTFTTGMKTDTVNRYAYTMAPPIFAPMLLIAEKVLGRPSARAVYAAFGSTH